jgi:hypothetical protein
LRRGTAEITWGRGTRAPQQVVRVTEIEVARVGVTPTPRSGPPLNSDAQRFTEDIGGQRATVWRNRYAQDYRTGAEWESMRVWIVGEASDPGSADVQLTIFRTVRFQTP